MMEQILADDALQGFLADCHVALVARGALLTLPDFFVVVGLVNVQGHFFVFLAFEVGFALDVAES
jgi:hypothetical protein